MIRGALDKADRHEPLRGLAVVVLPEFVTAKWWQDLPHNQTARLIKNTLIYRRGQVGKDRVIIDVASPYPGLFDSIRKQGKIIDEQGIRESCTWAFECAIGL